MNSRLAVLVDGDNISARHGSRILEIAKQIYEPTVARVYANAQRPSGWHDNFSYRMIHAGSGKNASDVLLAIDAMELALSGGFDAFLIASSDGDFSHVTQRLREYGATVTGVGEKKSPRSFRASCSSFVFVGSAEAIQLVPNSTAKVSDLDQKIRTIIAANSKNGAGMPIAGLGPKMHSKHGTRISTYPERTRRAHLAARPHLFDLDPRGPNALVRFRSEGFSAAA